MDYPQISALVPDGEHFDSSALNEGIWLTTGHFAAIEARLAANVGSINQLTGERDTARQELATAQENASAAATTAANDLQTANSTIAALQQEVATLKKGPASSFTNTTAGEDPATPGQAKQQVPFHESDADPTNQLADRLFGKPKQ